MTNVPQNTALCQDEEIPEVIPVVWPVWDTFTNEPTATPLADLMATSDPAGMDAEVMPFDEWLASLEVYELDLAYQYFEDEVTA